MGIRNTAIMIPFIFWHFIKFEVLNVKRAIKIELKILNNDVKESLE